MSKLYRLKLVNIPRRRNAGFRDFYLPIGTMTM